MPSKDCMLPLKVGEITSISPSGKTAWTEVDVTARDGCNYRIEILDLSGVLSEVITRKESVEGKGSKSTIEDFKRVFDVKMEVEKTPRQRYMHLKYTP